MLCTACSDTGQLGEFYLQERQVSFIQYCSNKRVGVLHAVSVVIVLALHLFTPKRLKSKRRQFLSERHRQRRLKTTAPLKANSEKLQPLSVFYLQYNVACSIWDSVVADELTFKAKQFNNVYFFVVNVYLRGWNYAKYHNKHTSEGEYQSYPLFGSYRQIISHQVASTHVIENVCMWWELQFNCNAMQ